MSISRLTLFAATLLLPLAAGCDAVEDVIDVVDPMPRLEMQIVNRTAPVSEDRATHVDVVVSNSGADAATNATAAITLPSGIAAFDEPRGLECSGLCSSGEEIVWPLGTLAPGETKLVTLPIRHNRFASGAGAALQVSGTLNADNADGVTSVASWPISDEQGTIELALDSDGPTVGAGAAISVRMDYANTSDDGYDATTLTFTAPEDYTLVSAEGATVDGRTARWALGRVEPFAAGSFAIQLRAPSGLDAGEIGVAQARIASTTNGLAGTAGLSFYRAGGTPLALTLVTNRQVLQTDEETSVTITATNTQSRTLNDATARVLLPDGIQSFPEPNGTSCQGNCSSSEALIMELGSMAPGETKTVGFNLVYTRFSGPTLPLILNLAAQFGGDLDGGFVESDLSSTARTLMWRVEPEED